MHSCDNTSDVSIKSVHDYSGTFIRENSLMAAQREDINWPENIENVEIFPSPGFAQLFYQCLYKRCTFFWVQNRASLGAVLLVRSKPAKSRKGFACDLVV